MKPMTAKAASLLLSLSMLASLTAPALASDLDGHWAQRDLQQYADSGRLTADSSGNYQPDRTVTGAEFTALLSQTSGLTVETGGAQTLTREEAFVLVAQALSLTGDDPSALAAFSDGGEVSDGARDSVAALASAGVVTGENGRLAPQEALTLAEAVTLLSRAFPAAGGAYTDGVYTGSATGYGGELTVQVTVSGGRIAAVEVVSQQETAAYYRMAEALLDQVVSAQSADLDAVSGATFSSYGILNAVKDALKGAGGAEAAAATYQVSSWAELLDALARASDGDTVQLAADITDAGQVDAVSSATATINKAVTLDGNGRTITGYDGQVTKNTTDSETGAVTSETVDATFCFDVKEASGITIRDLTIDGASFSAKLGGTMYVEDSAEVTLENVTIQNGTAGSSSISNGGGAIYVEPHHGSAPTLTARNCTFLNNAVADGSTGRGGAIAVFNGNVILENCTFAGNRAAYGGAVAAMGESSLTVKNCTFAASNDGVYGGDDLYLFDGYAFYKKGMARDAAVSYDISGNTYQGADGSDYTSYRVVLGRVLGEVTDTTSYSEAVTGVFYGTGSTLFLPGHDLTFAPSDYDRNAAPAAEKTVDPEDCQYVLMNVPYSAFYAAETVSNPVEVDAVSSATNTKSTKNAAGELVAGTYNDYDEAAWSAGTQTSVTIRGVQMPVLAAKADLEALSVSDRSADYFYTALDAAPSVYKVMNSDGSFSRTLGTSATLSEASVSLSTSTNWGDYLLTVANSGIAMDTHTIYGVVLTTQEGADYGLRMEENIWRGTELAWSSGIQITEPHGNVLNSAHYEALMGQTITTVTYYTDQGIYVISAGDDGLYVPVQFEQTFTVESAPADSGTAAVTRSGFPADYTPVYAVTNAAGEAADGFVCDGSALTWTGTPAVGAYTLTVSDSAGKYAPYSASFELQTDVIPVQFDGEKLTAADGAAQADADAYLAAVSAVQVDETTYNASGRSSAAIIGADGSIDFAAQFREAGIFTAGTTVTLTVTATGYSVPLTFTVTVPA